MMVQPLRAQFATEWEIEKNQRRVLTHFFVLLYNTEFSELADKPGVISVSLCVHSLLSLLLWGILICSWFDGLNAFSVPGIDIQQCSHSSASLVFLQVSESESEEPEETSAARPRRRPRGPIRSSRLSRSAQEQVEKKQLAQTRQIVAQEDPTLLSTNATFAEYASHGKISSSTIRALEQMVGEQTKMTKVQSLAFPLAREGWSLRVQSKTGSGKTIAFLVPTLERVLETPIVKSGGGNIDLLIIAPTRELVQQIGSTAEELLAFAPAGNVPTVQIVYGGTSILGQVRTMERKLPSILVTTPGRLVELLERKVRGRLFKHLLPAAGETNQKMTVVLDEADHLLQGFAPEMRQIFKFLPRKRQTLLFSATLATANKKSNRKHGALTTESIMGEPIVGIHDIDCVSMTGSADDKQLRKLVSQKANAAVNLNVEEFLYQLPSIDEYVPTLVSLLNQELKRDERSKIVVFFPATKLVQFMAEAVATVDSRLDKSMVFSIHSRMSQSARQRASRAFYERQTAILFSSDVSARGMDYPNVTNVIQYGLPQSRELYLHRLGRTARAGHQGKGLLVSLPFEKVASLRLKKVGLKTWNPEKKSATVLVPGGLLSNSQMIERAESAYKAFVAYYVGNGHDKDLVLEVARDFAHGVGLRELPELPDSLVK